MQKCTKSEKRIVVDAALGLSYLITTTPTKYTDICADEEDGRAFVIYEGLYGNDSEAGCRAMRKQFIVELEAADIERTEIETRKGTREKSSVFPDMITATKFVTAIMPSLQEAITNAVARSR